MWQNHMAVLWNWFYFTALYLCAAWLLEVETSGMRLVLKSCSIKCNLLSLCKKTVYRLMEAVESTANFKDKNEVLYRML